MLRNRSFAVATYTCFTEWSFWRNRLLWAFSACMAIDRLRGWVCRPCWGGLPRLGVADTGDAAGWPNYRMIPLPRVTDTDRMSPPKKAFRTKKPLPAIGWVTEAEQAALRGKRVAIAGAGGVGGVHLLTLARLGVGAFTIADMDRFDLVNFNRQAGAMMSTLDRPKVEVMAEMARDINPELDIRIFPDGVNAANLGDFLDGVDIYVDGLDFSPSRLAATPSGLPRAGIPAVTAAPLGMGTAVLSFLPGHELRRVLPLRGLRRGRNGGPLRPRAVAGDAQPGLPGRPSRVNFGASRAQHRRGLPAVRRVAAVETLKDPPRRGKVLCAPWGFQFDAYRNRLCKPGGRVAPQPASADRPVHRAPPVARDARLKPSGDAAMASRETLLKIPRPGPLGSQWRQHPALALRDRGRRPPGRYGNDTRDWCLYDFNGHASHMAHGAPLETCASPPPARASSPPGPCGRVRPKRRWCSMCLPPGPASPPIRCCLSSSPASCSAAPCAPRRSRRSSGRPGGNARPGYTAQFF